MAAIYPKIEMDAHLLGLVTPQVCKVLSTFTYNNFLDISIYGTIRQNNQNTPNNQNTQNNLMIFRLH